MEKRQTLPDKAHVDELLRQFRHFSQQQADYFKTIQQREGSLTTGINQLTLEKVYDPAFDLSQILKDSRDLDGGTKLNVLKSGLYVLEDMVTSQMLREVTQGIWWLDKNRLVTEAIQGDIADLQIDQGRIPQRSMGKLRGFFTSGSNKNAYIEQVNYLEHLNRQIKETGLLEKFGLLENDGPSQIAILRQWLATDFDKIAGLFENYDVKKLVDPQTAPDFTEAVQQLSEIGGVKKKISELETMHQYLITDVQQLSSQVVKDEQDARFKAFTMESFVSAYPGLPAKLLTERFRMVTELDGYSGYFEAIDGIGPKKSEQIANALASFKKNLYANPVFKLDPDQLTVTQETLIKAVQRLLQIEGRLRQSTEFQEQEAQLKLSWDVSLKSLRFLWLARKYEGETDFDQLLAGVTRTHEEAGQIPQEALSTTDLTEENPQVWFQQQAAAFYAVVEKYGGVKPAEDHLKSGIAKEILDKINAFEINEKLLKVSFRGWQVFGVKYSLVQKKVLIGDEMGLGKTIEAIGVMGHLAAEGKTHFLVVCPASIIINWDREIKKHSDLASIVLHGGSRNSKTQQWLAQGGVGITTYETLQRLPIPEEQPVDGLVIDEAHYVKNHTAKRSITVHRLAARSEFVLYMTGTPIENNVEEMTALIKTLQPKISQNIEANDFFTSPDKYRRSVAPVYLRRKKEDVLAELPPLTEIEEWVDFGEKEGEFYREAVAEGKFMKMRRAAWVGASPEESPKLNRLAEICEGAKENGEKIIVFTFFRSVLNRVLENFAEVAVQPIMGGVSANQRQEILDEFEQAPAGAVLPAQVIAGGFGLNIQAASIIVFCEPQIKPSLETQAIARAYRMGQTRPVFVYRLLTEESVDEGMMGMLAGKQQIFDEFAKDSYIATQTDQSVDTSDTGMIKNLIKQERERLQLDVEAPMDLGSE